jgi:hypothetical protein
LRLILIFNPKKLGFTQTVRKISKKWGLTQNECSGNIILSTNELIYLGYTPDYDAIFRTRGVFRGLSHLKESQL